MNLNIKRACLALAIVFNGCGENGNKIASIHSFESLPLASVSTLSVMHGYQTDSIKALLSVEIADTEGERVKGLMWRKSLHPLGGMLFVFDDEQLRTFWMKNTLIPLDIAFINGDSIVVDISQNLQPESIEPVFSQEKSVFVLEVNAGFFSQYHIKTGDRISVSLNNQ